MSQWRTQKSTATFAGRSDYAFAELARCLAESGRTRPRVLSFGCSQGFEPLDLKRLIAGAEVLGCDVNAKALADSAKRCEPEGITIFESTPEALASHGPYDAITVMNVLTRYPDSMDRPDIADLYPFEAFERTAAALVGALAPGGFLLLFNASYPVELAAAAGELEPVATPAFPANGWLEKYGRDSRRLTTVRGEFDGRLLPVSEWRAALTRESARLTDWRIFDIWPYRHEPVDPSAALPDLKTILWRRIGGPA